MENTCILIVEDDESVARGLVDILNGSGYQADWCEEARRALEIKKKQRIELVILDVNLGVENGYDLCKKIREFSEIPILFLTAYNSEMDLVHGFKVGGDDYIAKPFRIQELIVRVQALLKRGKRFGGIRMVSGNLTYDIEKRQVYQERTVLELTPIELQLVHTLLQNWPYTLSREGSRLSMGGACTKVR